MAALAQWVDPALLEPPANVMRLGLNPKGLAAGIVNLGEVRAYFVGRLERQVEISGDETLAALLEEVAGYPAPDYEHTDMGAPCQSSPLADQFMRDVAGDGEAAKAFLQVLNHDIPPSQLLTVRRLARAVARAARGRPGQIPAMLKEARREIRNEVRRFRQRRRQAGALRLPR